MATLYDVYPNDHISKIAEELKKLDSIKAPEWASFAKTGVHKERAPVEKDWWFKRAAAVLRTVAMRGPIGVSKLRTKYGGKKRRGHKMAKFERGSGSVIRKVLQQLQASELITFKKEGVHKGRVITSKGTSLLDKTANELAKTMEKPKVPKQETPKKEAEPKKEEASKEQLKEEPKETPEEAKPTAQEIVEKA